MFVNITPFIQWIFTARFMRKRDTSCRQVTVRVRLSVPLLTHSCIVSKRLEPTKFFLDLVTPSF